MTRSHWKPRYSSSSWLRGVSFTLCLLLASQRTTEALSLNPRSVRSRLVRPSLAARQQLLRSLVTRTTNAGRSARSTSTSPSRSSRLWSNNDSKDNNDSSNDNSPDKDSSSQQRKELELDLTSTESQSSQLRQSQQRQQQDATTTASLSASNPSSTSIINTTAAGIPSYRSILLFTCSTILIWLSEPLLSLVDTTVVGLASKRVEPLAALGPATMLMDSLMFMTYFLSIATTNRISLYRATKQPRQLQRTASHVLGVAAVLGCGILALVWLAGSPILSRMVSTQHSLVPLALRYCQIRSLVAPLAVMGMVAQSLCLACLDTVTPARAVLLASVLNVFGDVLLVKPMGLAGAALATAVASVVSSVVLLVSVKNKMRGWEQEHEWSRHANMMMNGDGVNGGGGGGGANDGGVQKELLTRVVDGAPVLTKNQTVVEAKEVVEQQPLSQTNVTDADAVVELLSSSSSSSSSEAAASSSSLSSSPMQPQQQQQQEKPVPFMSLPDRTSFVTLCRLAGPIFFVICGKVVCYSAMTLRATDFGMIPLACHNIMMRIFYFYAIFGDSLSQAAQSYLPQVLVRQRQQQHDAKTASSLPQNAVKVLLKRLLRMGAGIGLLNLTMSKWILHTCGRYLTSNASIVAMMKDHSTFMSLALMLHPFIMTFEGAMVATQDLTCMMLSYVVTMGLLFAQLKFATTSFAGVWVALFVFQTLRLTQFSTRVWNKTVRREYKDATASAVSSLLETREASVQS